MPSTHTASSRRARASASTSRAGPRTARIAASCATTARSRDLAPFAERGGESVVADREGNVYVANGQIFVYRPTGEPIGRIDVPERPTGLRFAPDGRTLYVLTHHSLYGVKTR